MELWNVIKEITPKANVARSDRVLLCLNRGVITEQEAQLVIAWLAVFQIEEFAQ